jgi:hypothetical protein
MRRHPPTASVSRASGHLPVVAVDDQDLAGSALGVDGEHEVPVEVRHPPAPLAPARALEEGPASNSMCSDRSRMVAPDMKAGVRGRRVDALVSRRVLYTSARDGACRTRRLALRPGWVAWRLRMRGVEWPARTLARLVAALPPALAARRAPGSRVGRTTGTAADREHPLPSHGSRDRTGAPPLGDRDAWLRRRACDN